MTTAGPVPVSLVASRTYAECGSRTGIARILASYEGLATVPEFFASDHFLIVKLPVLRYARSLTSEESAVLKCFRKGRLLTRVEVQEAADIGRAKAIRTLNAPIDKGYLRKVGSGRATRYELSQG